MPLKLKAFQAPHTFDFKDPDTGRVFNAPSQNLLVQSIVSYRSQNQLDPIENLNIVLENYWCSQPQNFPRCEDNYKLSRSFQEYAKGGVSLFKQWLFKKFASQEVAEARALQCSTCPENVFPDKGAFLKFTDQMALLNVQDRRTLQHEKLGNCAVCTCVLKSKVFYEGSLAKFTPEQVVRLKKVNCWQLELSGQKEDKA